MPKINSQFDPALYAPVAERIRLFYASYEHGRIVTELISRSSEAVVFKALVYRNASDSHPAATGWAAEREGDGDINRVACLENTETSAVGRALANLGFTAGRERPSLEEMEKAQRGRMRLRSSHAPSSVRAPRPLVVREQLEDPYGLNDVALQSEANRLLDFLRLIQTARHHGLRAARAQRWEDALRHERRVPIQLALWEARLALWITRVE